MAAVSPKQKGPKTEVLKPFEASSARSSCADPSADSVATDATTSVSGRLFMVQNVGCACCCGSYACCTLIAFRL